MALDDRVEQLVRAVARELGSHGVTVNSVAPGPIDSPFYHAVETEESARHAAQLSVAGRLGCWEDIVGTVLFLCSPHAQWVSAQTIRVNGAMAA